MIATGGREKEVSGLEGDDDPRRPGRARQRADPRNRE
jgi:hypothetical protein